MNIKIDGKILTTDELFEHSKELTAVANQITIIDRLIENVEYSRVSGDTFTVHRQIYSGLLDEIGTSLSEIKETIQTISNKICPD